MSAVIARPSTIEKALNAACRATHPSARGADKVPVKEWERHQHTVIDKLEAKLREVREKLA